MKQIEKITAKQYMQYKKTGKLGTTDNPKPRKYKNIPTEISGIKFDSKKEANRYAVLMLMHKQKLISKPVLQYEFVLVGCSYICDFLYLDYEKKQFVVEDSKGMRTKEYKIKAKQMKEIYGITILET